MEVKSQDRVLLLALPPVDELRGMAERVPDAIFVAGIDADLVHETRRQLCACPNVMITPSDPAGTLPWKEEFFSVVFAPDLTEPSPEVLRVLAPGGTAWIAGGPVTKR